MKYFIFFIGALFFGACSFDYGGTSGKDDDRPTLVLSDVEYIRMENGELILQFEADTVERFDAKSLMKCENFSFEHFENQTAGQADTVSIELETGNLTMDGNIVVTSDSEETTITTGHLEWDDTKRTITGSPDDHTSIEKADGTSMSGWGFSAQLNSKSWEFSEGGQGFKNE
ncbi:hypothetical protein FACS1894172_06090 [Spirochaetia bacterium]|nr:hypothetical protein FACS1894164_04870 [Spirochaetia bacterium]GHU31342.1 hypothetical protein FACS1894172_06090 [Spirochaetia bacterium]